MSYNVERETSTLKVLFFGDFFVRVKLVPDSKNNCWKNLRALAIILYT